jgi:hypothetical protein
MGRYKNKPRYERLCSGCLKVENEVHFLFECNSYSTLRDNFTNSISSIVPNDLKLNNDQKLIYLMTCEDKNILRLTPLFIFNCFKRREISQLVVLPNKFAFEENKLINVGRFVSMTVFLYLFNSLKCFFIYLSRYGFAFVSL